MPAFEVTVAATKRVFDARPDRADYRDRPYLPPLASLPPEYPLPGQIARHFPQYANLVRDQGEDGACTGFGLAALINYLQFTRKRDMSDDSKEEESPALAVTAVSPAMLYQLARVYDEWDGEDYEGSSCRGAMKGWHKHGVCAEEVWEYEAGRFIPPKEDWPRQAAQLPLGAYYRVDQTSITDMQAAIFEIGAVYASADVTNAWFEPEKCKTLPLIQLEREAVGGHAFALVGYNEHGFIVQNSWGKKWGYCGFAILGYDEWMLHGSDVWAAALGAPMTVAQEQRTRTALSLQQRVQRKVNRKQAQRTHVGRTLIPEEARPWSEEKAVEHSIVIGNNGRPLNRLIDHDFLDPLSAVHTVAYSLPLEWLNGGAKRKRVAIYAHGGLNDEADAIQRVQILGPYFEANDIYPIFLVWKTGVWESISGILSDHAAELGPDKTESVKDVFEKFKQRVLDARDRGFEALCERVLVKALWSQMKQNAAVSVERDAAANLVLRELDQLHAERSGNLEVHLIGHSAGSIILGHMLSLLTQRKLKAATCHLYAPACTIEFALAHYQAAHHAGTLSAKDLFVELMSDERERADSVGPYGKSLLYLISRALESVHKKALLGMEASWNLSIDLDGDVLTSDEADMDAVTQWRTFVAKCKPNLVVSGANRAKVSNGPEMIDLAHGSFDNDVVVISRTLKQIRNGADLKQRVLSLKGF